MKDAKFVGIDENGRHVYQAKGVIHEVTVNMSVSEPHEMSKWIKCSDRMPEEGVPVDVYFRPSNPSEEPRRVPDCKIVDGAWVYWSESGDHYQAPCYQELDSGFPDHWMCNGIPTHWMPLPSPPEDSQ